MKQKNQQMIIPMLDQPQGIVPIIKEQTYRHITIPLDGPIDGDISLYRQCIEELKDANQGDYAEIVINTDGGSLQTALAMITAIEQSEAEVVADIEGMAASAGSLVALHCQGLKLNPYSTMFIHAESFMAGGKRNEVKSQVEFSLKWVEKIIRDTYKHFLTEQEIEQVLDGRDLYFDAKQIKQRFEHRIKMLEEEAQSEDESSEEEVCECCCGECCEECGNEDPPDWLDSGSDYDKKFYGDEDSPCCGENR